MNKRPSISDKPFVQESRKEDVSGVRAFTEEGSKGATSLSGGVRIQSTITIGRPATEVYSFWRDFRNLPRFCQSLRDVVVLNETRSRWTVDGPMNKSLTWEAQLIEDHSDKLISWQSLEGADFENAGSVRFQAAPADRGTEVTLTMSYNPPAGPLGSLIAKLTAKDPAVLLRQQLRRLKQLLETGEIATTEGQAAVLKS